MNTLKKISSGVLVFAAALTGQTASAQSDVSELIKSSPQDITLLTRAYLNPLFKGIGVGLNSGWNYSGKAKNTGRFDLRFSVSGAMVPTSAESFDVTKLGLSDNLRLKAGSPSIAPTVSGDISNRPVLEVYDDNGRKLEEFTMPEGANLSFIPTPMIQGTVGLPKGIDLTLRTIPKINLGDDYGSLSMLGGGVKVEVLPLIFGKKADKILPFDIGASVGFTQFKYTLPLEVEPADNSERDPNQEIEAKFTGINTELIFSKKLMLFTPFVSVGYQTSNTKADLKGEYTVLSGATVVGPIVSPSYTTLKNPVSIDQKDVSGVRANVGFNLNLAFFRLFAAYSVGEYTAVNAGIGFGIGK